MPLELITMLASGLMGGLMTLWSMSLKEKAQNQKFMIDRLSAERGAIQDARAYSNANPSVQWTKRVLAIMTVFSVIALPKLAALFGLPPVTVGYTEFHPGFWFFTDGRDVVEWKEAVGFVITPLDTHFCSAIAGFYFGSSAVKNV